MKRILLLLFVLFSTLTFAQVGVNTTNPDPSSMLDISATNKGVLVPRVSLANVTTTMLDGTNTAATGLLIWNTNAATVGGNGVGFYFFNGTQWMPITQTGSTDHDFYEVGGTTAPDAITDNKYTQGTLTIGTNTAASGVLDIDNATKSTSLDISNTNTTDPIGIKIELNSINSTKTGIDILLDGTNDGFSSFIHGEDKCINTQTSAGLYQLFDGSTSSTLNNKMGIYNDFLSTSNYQGILTGVYNVIYNNSNGDTYGINNTITGNGTGNKYGSYNQISPVAGGTHYGVYSDALKAGSYAGYFLGRTSIGTTTSNNYILPASRGTNGQTMQTDGSGNVSWVTPTISTDDQQIDVLSLTGDTLNISLQDDGVATQTVNLTSLKNTLDQAYDQGGAGVGRTITADAGAVTINGTDGLVTTGTFGSGAVAPSGAGTKMFFNPKKGAFRAGNINGVQWDDASIGNYSIAMGQNVTASGINSVAFGGSNTASGMSSVAFGLLSNATSDAAFVGGLFNTASGAASTAFGYSSLASGVASTALGNNNFARSFGETVIGIGATDYTPINTVSAFPVGATDRLFVVGNAIDTNMSNDIQPSERSNALVILKNGETGLGANPTTGNRLTVGGKTATTDFQMTSGATANYIMQSDGAGNATWVNPSTINGSDHDIYEVGGTTSPNAITDDKYTQGTLTIGTNTAATGVLDIDNSTKATSLDINNTFATNPTGIDLNLTSNAAGKSGIKTQFNGTAATGTNTFIQNTDNMVGNTNRTAISNDFSGTSSSISTSITGLKNDFKSTSNYYAILYGINNSFASNTNAWNYGVSNSFTNSGSTPSFGVVNGFAGTSTGDAKGILNGSNNYNGNVFGVVNDFEGTGDGIHYAINNNLAGAGNGTVHGHGNRHFS